jgi:methanogenic corrinoid protein MtbC1
MNDAAVGLPEGPLSGKAIGYFAGSLDTIRALVQKKLHIDLAAPRHASVRPREPFLRDFQEQFGRTLLAVYSLGIFDALPEEISAMSAQLRARGFPDDFFPLMINAWIVAIHGSAPSSTSGELVETLEWMKQHAAHPGPGALPAPLTPDCIREGAEAPFLLALLAQRSRKAEKLLRDQLDSGVPVERICTETIFPALREIGFLWQHNRLTASEEHIATTMLRRAVYGLFSHAEKQPPGENTVVVTCAPGEEHEISAELYALYLETKGWPVLFLGHSAPEKDVLLAIQGSEPFALIISAMLIRHLPAAVRLAERVKASMPSIRIVAGGAASERAERALSGSVDAVARDLAGIHALLQSLAGEQ